MGSRKPRSDLQHFDINERQGHSPALSVRERDSLRELRRREILSFLIADVGFERLQAAPVCADLWTMRLDGNGLAIDPAAGFPLLPAIVEFSSLILEGCSFLASRTATRDSFRLCGVLKTPQPRGVFAPAPTEFRQSPPLNVPVRFNRDGRVRAVCFTC